MIALAVYLVSEAGWSAVDLDLHTGPTLSGWATVGMMAGAIAIVVPYFSGPMLNFGDFARYGRSFGAVKRGNVLGLPVNFLFFLVLTVVCASATVPVFGELITDPIETVERIDAPVAILLGGVTFVTATVGINIVANFIAPAFDFSNVSPQKIGWQAGGMVAAVGSVLLTPWNWYDNADGIRFSLGILGSLIGPLFGILIAGYYVCSRQRIAVDDMYSMSPRGRYWFRNGYNPNAVIAIAAAGIPTILLTLFASVGDYGWFIGCALGFTVFVGLERVRPMIPVLDPTEPGISDGARAWCTCRSSTPTPPRR
ncbi:cytosine permease [Geodermatophilus obscurus]|uniref:cytosine permease n=1 Tax=Geodermatophilus obscurus TaxID=1861 RepID=UPI00019B7FB6|nr:cytosine permease [Geodermatophilus obscurus]